MNAPNYSYQSGMLRRHPAARRLRPLVLECATEDAWPDLQVSVVHFLADAARYLGIPDEDLRWLLGPEAYAFWRETDADAWRLPEDEG